MRAWPLFLGVLLGAGAVFLLGLLRSPTPDEFQGPMRDREVRSPAEGGVDTQAILDRLDGIERTLIRLARRDGTGPVGDRVPARLVGTPEARERAAAADLSTAFAEGTIEIDPDSLATAMQEVAARKWDGLGNAQLRQEARRLWQKDRDPLQAQAALERLLTRDLEVEEKVGVMTQLGMVQRSSGDLEASSVTLERALEIQGIDTAVGAEAAGQLAWTRAKLEDFGGALDLAERIAVSPGATDQLATNAKWAIGVLAQGGGDTGRARAEYRRFLLLVGDDPQYAKLAEDVKRRLESLE